MKDRFDQRKAAEAAKKKEDEAAQMQKMRQRAETEQSLEREEWAEEKRRQEELEQAKKDAPKIRTAEMEERAAAAQVGSSLRLMLGCFGMHVAGMACLCDGVYIPFYCCCTLL